MTSFRETAARLRDSCTVMEGEANALSQALGVRDSPALALHLSKLRASVAHHLDLAEAVLPAVARRRLLHDHRRLGQLMRALDLVVGDDPDEANVIAREIAALLARHSPRESGAITVS